MPLITDTEAVNFANEKLRPLADALGRVFYMAEQLADEWNTNNLGEKFGLGDTVADGSHPEAADPDGRHPITGNDVVLMVTRANELVTDYRANSNAKLGTVLNVAVNVTRIP